MRALALCCAVMLCAATPSPGIQDILKKMAAQQSGLISYQVPVDFDIHFRWSDTDVA